MCLAGLLLALGCRPKPAAWPEPEATPLPPPVKPAEAMRPVPGEALPLLLDDGDRSGLRLAAEHSRRWYAGRPPGQPLVFGPRTVAAAEMARALTVFLGWLDAGLSPEALAAEVARSFEVFESVGGAEGRMLVTGYFEPIVDGSLTPTVRDRVPLYRPPGVAIRVDLGRFGERFAGEKIAGRLEGGELVPFPTRGEIRKSGVYRGHEIAWLRDPLDAFFLEIQGSGTVRLPDGGELRLGYAASNGRPYSSIGKLLADEGKIERGKVSMQSIRAWLEANPGEIERVLDSNESTVFFRRLDGPAQGSLGVPVTAGRSVATDRSLFPPGALGFLISEVPAAGADGTTVAERPLVRFVLNQDTGGAIRGAGRVDFFWGRGAAAGEKAGLMKQPGRLFFLLPRVPSDPE